MRLLCHNARLLFAGFILLIACEKEKIEPVYTDAVLKGTAFFWNDAYQSEPLSNVTVKANGPYGSRTAVTNANGEYEIRNVGNGTYEIEFIKKGWGALKYYSVQIFGNETLTYSQLLWKYPVFDMPALQIVNSEGYVTFRSNLPSGTIEVPDLRAFFSKSSDVSCFQYDFSNYVYSYESSDYIHYDFGLWPEFPGRFIYVIFYLIDPRDNGEYDPYRAAIVFPSINPDKHSQVFKYDLQ